MTETDAVVVRVEGDHVLVRAERAGKSCGVCTRPGGCQGAGMGSVLDGALGRPPPPGLLRLLNTIHAKPGDAVVLRAEDGTVLRAVWLAYGIPLLLGLAGALILNLLTGSDLAAALGMLAGLLGGYLFMHRKGLDSGCAEPILSISFKRTV